MWFDTVEFVRGCINSNSSVNILKTQKFHISEKLRYNRDFKKGAPSVMITRLR